MCIVWFVLGKDTIESFVLKKACPIWKLNNLYRLIEPHLTLKDFSGMFYLSSLMNYEVLEQIFLYLE